MKRPIRNPKPPQDPIESMQKTCAAVGSSYTGMRIMFVLAAHEQMLFKDLRFAVGKTKRQDMFGPAFKKLKRFGIIRATWAQGYGAHRLYYINRDNPFAACIADFIQSHYRMRIRRKQDVETPSE